jgi:integrase
MPTTIRFLDTVIRNIQPSDKRDTYWCDGCPGFGLRVTPSGAKSFVYKYMNGRQSRWITIGQYPEWSIRKARREYDTLYEQVYAYGRDPVAERREQAREAADRQTVAEFSKTYLDLRRQRELVSTDDEELMLKRDVLPEIGSKFLCQVTSSDIEAIQTRIVNRARKRKNASRGGRVAVKNTVACVRRMFDLAIKKNRCSVNPVKDIEAIGMTGARDRVLTLKEIWLFWNGIESSGLPPVIAGALKFELLTMQRSIEVRHMSYSSLKLDEGVWQMEMRETKSRRMHRVPLSRHALSVIEQMRQYTGRSSCVFGATRARKPPRKLQKSLKPFGKTALPQALRRSRKALGIENICPHDLRRTGATWITAVGLPKLYARLMLNHSDGENDVTAKVYVQYSYDFEKLRASKVWEYVLDQIVSAPTVDAVPTLDVLRERVKSNNLL